MTQSEKTKKSENSSNKIVKDVREILRQNKSKKPNIMKTPRIKTNFNPHYKGHPSDIKFSKSQTMPDQSIGIKDLLKNHTRGNAFQQKEYEEQYFEHHEIPIFEDLTDIAEYRQQLEERRETLQQEIDNNIKANLEVQKQALKIQDEENIKKQVTD